MTPGGYFIYGWVGIKPLKETNLGEAQDFLTPKRDHIQNIKVITIK